MRRLLAALLCVVPGLALAAQNEIVVSLKQHHLYLVNGDRVVADYPVVVGKPSTPTPTGHYHISQIRHHPAWYVPASIMKGRHHPKKAIVPSGPRNPLGVVFMRLSSTSIGIHGTNAPWAVPGWRSHGCIRLKNQNVVKLAALVHVGTPVTVMKGPFSVKAGPVQAVVRHPAEKPVAPFAAAVRVPAASQQAAPVVPLKVENTADSLVP